MLTTRRFRRHVSVCGFAVFLFLGLSPFAAAAQVPAAQRPDANLMSLEAVRVTASQTTSDAITCGLDLRSLLPGVESSLQAGGLRMSTSTRTIVTVSLLTMHDDARGICSTATMLGAYRMVDYFDETEGWLRTGYVVLWQRGVQVVSSPADHPMAIERAAARLADTLLETWRQQNRLAGVQK